MAELIERSGEVDSQLIEMATAMLPAHALRPEPDVVVNLVQALPEVRRRFVTDGPRPNADAHFINPRWRR
jgi:hypothetical protein